MENNNTQEPEQKDQIEEVKLDQETGEAVAISTEKKKQDSSATNFDFGESVKETRSILKDAILRPHAIVSSSRTIRIQTSGLILLALSLLIGICTFLFYRFGFDGLLSMFSDIGFMFAIRSIFSWVITFAVGYFSLYLLLLYTGNRKMDHKELLTKYAIVNIPFAIVFCLVILLFGFLMVDLFVITYVFALMLYGVLHIYLFLVHMKEAKFDLYWTIAGYLLVLIVATYVLNGIDIATF
ncbi:hypothetical protein [Gracilibacillus lacisalsi]|uniref:hypothetical protein n=1 Tax=Gracilibacillus lacisalsi TaxID=393087 RepID=UPI00037C1FAA|nr:hypothetical protein [Gracilibacillus lacisalsi]